MSDDTSIVTRLRRLVEEMRYLPGEQNYEMRALHVTARAELLIPLATAEDVALVILGEAADIARGFGEDHMTTADRIEDLIDELSEGDDA